MSERVIPPVSVKPRNRNMARCQVGRWGARRKGGGQAGANRRRQQESNYKQQDAWVVVRGDYACLYLAGAVFKYARTKIWDGGSSTRCGAMMDDGVRDIHIYIGGRVRIVSPMGYSKSRQRQLSYAGIYTERAGSRSQSAAQASGDEAAAPCLAVVALLDGRPPATPPPVVF